MTKVHPHKRIFYVPGLISLMVLPLVLWHFYRVEYKKTNQRIITVSWWQPDLFVKYPEVFTINIPFARNYLRIDLTGNVITDKVKLDYIQVRLNEIVATNDSINGVQVHLGKNARYDSFVQTLNLCKIEKINVYAPYQNDIWILYEPPNPSYVPQIFPCSTAEYQKTITIEEPDKRPEWVKLRDKLQSTFSSFWLVITLGIGLLSLCLFAFFYLKQTW